MEVKEDLVHFELDEHEVLVSVDVKGIFRNVPVVELINLAAKFLNSRPVTPPFEKETFLTLTVLWLICVTESCLCR